MSYTEPEDRDLNSELDSNVGIDRLPDAGHGYTSGFTDLTRKQNATTK